MRHVILTCLALGALGACNQLAGALLNTTETTQFKAQDDLLFMSGLINSQTGEQFEDIIAANPQVTTVVECYIEGSIDDDAMIPLSYRVRELGLNTHLTSQSEIYSGGVDFFLAGVERTMANGAVIGVHAWSDGLREATDYPRSSPEHEANRRYIEVMLGDDAFYWFTIFAAPADDMYEMTNDEVLQFNLLTAPIMASGTGPQCPEDFLE